MKLDVEEILARVERTESDMQVYRNKCKIWESMWRLEPFTESRQAAEQDNREQVVLPGPKNVVNLGKRLLSSTPRIDVPSHEITDEGEENAESRKRFLDGLWSRSNKEQGTNHVGDAGWNGLVKGRFAFKIQWVKSVLPKRMQKSRLPILIQSLNPEEVGIRRGPLYTLWAYHRYETDEIDVISEYEDYTPKENTELGEVESTVTVCDFWYIDGKDGAVWHAVIVDDDFAMKPEKTDYPDIPIIVSGADKAPTDAEETKFEPILEGLRELWPYQCRLASQLATGLLWYFWPAVVTESPTGKPLDIEVGPGSTTNVPKGTKVEVVQLGGNMQMLESMLGQLSAAEQQSTFPGVMYGDSGQMQAGFGVNMLLDSAKGRINDLKTNLEWAISWVNEMALGIVEEMADKEGVSVWGFNEASEKMVSATLTADQIEGFYENHVSISPNLPSDNIQKQTIGLRQVEQGIFSRDTYRKKFLDVAVESNEEKKVILERAMNGEKYGPLMDDMILAQFFQDNEWARKVAERYQPQPPEPEPGPMMGPPPGAMTTPAPIDGLMPPGPPPGPPMGPPGLDPSMQPPPMLDPSMPPQMEGMLTEDQMPPGMPPEIYQMIVNGQSPEGEPNFDELDAMIGA